MSADIRIAEQIRKARNAKGITQEKLGELLHQSKQTISNWERGISRPSIDYLPGLEKELGIKIIKNTRSTSNLDLKPMMELSTMKETSESIKKILSEQKINSVYESSIRKMLELTLWLLVGYYRYYEENRYKRLSLEALKLEWNDLSEDLEELINPNDERYIKFFS